MIPILLHRLKAENFKQLGDVTLDFPASGTILIEGENEAGKSCLFEAVFFALYGRTLIRDQDYHLEHLRSYGSEELRVELEFSIEGRPFTIARRVGRNHTVRLTCPAAEGQTETITAAREVGRRLAEELRLSAEALLNTCFVEQKGLERLEDLDQNTRRTTINELLNIRSLTLLESEFKVLPEHRSAVQCLKERAGVAQLDAALPSLQEEERNAARCILYARLRRASGQLAEIERRLEALAQVQATAQREREILAAQLATCNALKERLAAIRESLMLRAQAWATAARARADAAARVAALEALAAGLPARERQLQEWHALLTELQELERLETEARALTEGVTGGERAVEEWDRLKEEWNGGERRRKALDEERKTREAALAGAAAAVLARQVARARDGRLELLLRHAEARARAEAEAAELAKQVAAAQTAEQRLPDLRSHLARLEALERHGREREQVSRDLEHARAELAAHHEAAERLCRLGEELARLEKALSAAEAAECEAATALKGAKQRVALEDWAEAAERAAEGDPAAGRSAEVTSRRATAQSQSAAAARRAQEAKRQAVPGYAAAALALLLGAAAVVSGLLLPFGIPALIALAAGAALIARSRRTSATAKAEEAEARRELDRLEGEWKAVQEQAAARAAERQRWIDREAECRRALAALGLAPDDPAAARSHVAALPAGGVSARDQAFQAARQAVLEARVARDVAGQQEETERAALAKVDAPALAGEARRLEAEERLLAEAIAAAGEAPADLESALPEVRDKLAAAGARAAAISDLDGRLAEKRDQEAAARGQLQTLAQELQLAGDDPGGWHRSAEAERDAFAAAVLEQPDAALLAEAERARRAFDDARQQLTVLATEQHGRDERLKSPSRAELAASLESARAGLARNAEDREPLRDVRSALAAAELPTEVASLAPRLAGEHAGVQQVRREAEGLPAAREEEGQRAAACGEQARELAEAWSASLPDEPAPGDPAGVLDRLPELEQQAQAELDAVDEPALLAADAAAQRRSAEIAAEVNLCDRERDSLRAAAAGLRAELGAGEDEPVDALTGRFPELAPARAGEVKDWEIRLSELQEAVRDNRSRRQARAETLRLGEDLLDLAVEREALAAAEQDLAVRQRAGRMVQATRQSIVNSIMPLTMQNMRQLLPLLTAGRYQDVQWDEASNTLSVYDNRARAYQRKRVFSGGARDQISLALRLAFALATLPGEHNARPGWLFLDEPLSSFDRARTQALVDLITRGLIRKQFAQILLISHSDSVDPGQFDHHLRMEEGRVVGDGAVAGAAGMGATA